jgi:hypothetical protein
VRISLLSRCNRGRKSTSGSRLDARLLQLETQKRET